MYHLLRNPLINTNLYDFKRLLPSYFDAQNIFSQGHNNWRKPHINAISGTVFKADIMPTCDFWTYLKDIGVSQARPFPFPWQHQSHIGCKYWKQSALWNRKDLTCETK